MKRTVATVVLFVLATFGSFVNAAELTQPQLVTLKNDINANFLTEWNAQQIDVIVAAYNAAANPAFTVWKPNVDASMYRDSITWTELTGRTAGERDMFSFLTGGGALSMNCTKTNVRQAIQDAFSGSSGVNSRTALIALCKRSITRLERLYATGTGSDASPGALVVEGALTEGNVLEAMGQ